MEFSLMLQRLWRLRVLVALGVVVAAVLALLTVASVSLSPLSVDRKKGAEFGAAMTTIYVDTSRASVATTQGDTAGLTARAQIFARFINSGAVRAAAARRLGVPPAAITVSGPNPDSPGQQSSQPAAQQRANALISPGSPYSVFVDTESNAPTITLFTQAGSAERAVALARAITAALGDEVVATQKDVRSGIRRALQDQLKVTAERKKQPVSAAERRQATRAAFAGESVIKPLGDPVGGGVKDESGRGVALVVFLAILLVWCVGILLLSGVVRTIRRRSPDAPDAQH